MLNTFHHTAKADRWIEAKASQPTASETSASKADLCAAWKAVANIFTGQVNLINSRGPAGGLEKVTTLGKLAQQYPNDAVRTRARSSWRLQSRSRCRSTPSARNRTSRRSARAEAPAVATVRVTESSCRWPVKPWHPRDARVPRPQSDQTSKLTSVLPETFIPAVMVAYRDVPPG